MANAVLYFRTETTLTNPIDTGVDNLKDNFPLQVLEYDAPNDILEAVNEVYENRINPQQSINSAGTRRIFLRDDGLKGRRFVIRGRMKKTSTDLGKLKTFRVLKSTTTTLIHGVFGIKIDSAPFYNINPTSASGLMIGRVTTGYVGQKPTRHGFEIELFFGGTHE